MKNLFIVTLMLFFAISTVRSQTEMWGMSSLGGDQNAGAIFKTDGTGGNLSIEHTFNSFVGKHSESTPLEASNGKIYVMTKKGGLNDYGVLFEYDPNTMIYTKKIDFSIATGTEPEGSLIQASNGKLYGLMRYGGSNFGTLFEYNILNNSLTVLSNFNGIGSGSYPRGSLIQEPANGKLYGMTSDGGDHNKGTIFEYDIVSDVLTRSMSFNGTNGDTPLGGFFKASNGWYYGMTLLGGQSNKGVLFSYLPLAPSNVNIKQNFSSSTGEFPQGDLIESGDKLYGMTRYGGVNNQGVIFNFDINTDVFSSLKSLSSSTTGKFPFGSLTKATNGHLYGLTEQGGANNEGVLFKYVIASNTLTIKKSFNSTTTGKNPRGNLIQASNGNLFGLTYSGGVNNKGIFFEYKISTNSFLEQYSLYTSNEGKRPFGTLTKVNNNLFGVTAYGGNQEMGVIFKYNPLSSTYTKLIDFDGASKGQSPYGNMTLANNGKLYGMTRYGGANGEGVLFEFDPVSSAFVKKMNFDNVTSGRYPRSGLVLASNGLMYGVTRDGGTSDIGVLFSYDPNTNAYVKIRDFNGSYRGKFPYGNLIQAANGKLYGMTREGGLNDEGVLFEYDIIGDSFVRKVSFSDVSKGKNPYGDLVEHSSGVLYGMTGFGGTNGVGVLFEFDINTNTYTKKLNLNNSQNPFSSMTKASNGKLYGMIRKGGANDDGVLFQYNTATNTFTNKHDFDETTASVPYYSNLLEINSCYTTFATINATEWCSYTSPSGNSTWTTSGSYIDTIANACGGDSVLTINLTITIETYEVIRSGNQLTVSENGAVYQWLDCNNNYAVLPGETNQSYTVTTNGSYAVSVTKSGCTDTSSCFSFNALYFDGYNDRVVCSNTSSNNMHGGTAGFTIEAWIYPTVWEGNAEDGVIIMDESESSGWFNYKRGYRLAVGDQGKVHFKIGYNNIWKICETSGSTLVLNKWQHVAATYTGNYMRIYVDGIFIKQQYCYNYEHSTSPTYIGYGSNGKGFHGKIDEMRLWKKTKTTSEIKNEMYRELCEFPTELKAYYTFNQGVSGGINSGVTTLLDHSTYGNNGTLSGFSLNGSSSNWVNGLNLIDGIVAITTCSNSYTSLSGNQTWTASGIYTDTLLSVHTCDSIISVNLTINGTTASRTDTVCDRFTNPNNQYYYSSGVYTYTLTNAVGCDSVVTLNLTVKQSTDTTLIVHTCDSLVSASGITWYTSGVYKDTIPNIEGCDSVLTYQLSISTTTLSITQNNTISCYGDSSGVASVSVVNTGKIEVFFEGFENYTGSSNIYSDGYLAGLDSCFYSNTINTSGRLRIPGRSIFVRTGVKSITLDRNSGGALTSTNYLSQIIDLSAYASNALTFSFWFINHGGTSHAEDRVWIRGNSSDVWVEAFDWESNSSVGQWTYQELDITSLLAGAGQSVTASFQYRFGQRDSRRASGMTYYSGLTVDDISIKAKNRTTSYLWSNGDTTSSIMNVPAGQYLVTVNSTVCSSSDSITITQPYEMNFYQALTSCDSLDVHGNMYYYSQTIKDTLIASNGCDSLVTTILTINYPSATVDVQTACVSYTWIDGNTYISANNSATYTLTNSVGCDSVVTLDLTITTIDNSVTVTDPTIVANAVGATYQWLDCEDLFTPITGANSQTYTASDNGEYAVKITKNMCVDTSECVLISTVSLANKNSTNAITIYPNPTKGLINIDLKQLKNVTINLYDINGKLLQSKFQTKQRIIQINAPYDNGVYILEIHSDDEVIKFRIVLN